MLLVELLLLVCSIAVTVTALELLLRRYYPIGEKTVRFDRQYLYRYTPNARAIFRFSAANGGKKLLVTINSEGRRGDPVSMSRPHIMVYGDSFIASIFTPIKQTFVWQLERKLGRTNASAPQVVNCGVGGYGPDQESLVMEDEIDRLKPQLVIVSIYAGNDFGDLMRHKIYKLDEEKQLKSNNYTIDPSVVSLMETSQYDSPFFTLRLLKRAWEKLAHTETRTLSSSAADSNNDYVAEWLSKCRAEYEEYIVNGNNRVWDLVDGHYDADISLTPDSESSQYKRILMDRVIEKMKRITAARSTPLMLVIIPSPVDVVDGYAVSVDVRKYPDYRRAELTDVVEQIARKYQLPYVNLFSPFREHGAGPLYYVVDNDHWKPEGQQLAAGLVAECIKQHHLLDTVTGASGGTPQ